MQSHTTAKARLGTKWSRSYFKMRPLENRFHVFMCLLHLGFHNKACVAHRQATFDAQRHFETELSQTKLDNDTPCRHLHWVAPSSSNISMYSCWICERYGLKARCKASEPNTAHSSASCPFLSFFLHVIRTIISPSGKRDILRCKDCIDVLRRPRAFPTRLRGTGLL